MTGRRLDIGEALDIATQILSGLSAAHAAGLVHRDLKPDNVMIAAGGLVKVLDFGLAKRKAEASAPTEAGDTTSLLTSEGRLLGTPAYMSPEQIAGGAVDARSDLFSLGVMLYEMLCFGQRPFTGASAGALFAAVLTRQPEPPVQIRPEIGDALSKVVLRCLAKDPDARHADAAALASDLSSAAPMQTQTAIEPTASRTSVATPPRPGRARRRAAAALAAIAAVAIAGWLGLRQLGDRPAAESSSPSASAAATAAPRPTAVTELPIPPSRSEEARAAYAAAMRALRDANGEGQIEHMKRAVELERVGQTIGVGVAVGASRTPNAPPASRSGSSWRGLAGEPPGGRHGSAHQGTHPGPSG